MKLVQLFVGFICFCLATPVVSAGLVCTNSTHDYGTVSSASTVSHVFEVQNTGTNTVKITRVRKTCGCTTASASKKILTPGDTSEIHMHLSLKGRYGKQRKAMYVHTDSLETPWVRLEMKGIVQK